MRVLSIVSALVLALAPVAASATALPPYLPPTAGADVGFPNATNCPFIVLGSGQSNLVGEDHNGAHLVGANVYTTNNFTNPTAVVSAAYGAAPYNVGYGGGPNAPQITTSNAALTNVNQLMAFSYYLRASGMIPASRPIVIMPAAAGGQSVADWVAPIASVTASQSATTLTVSAVASGALQNFSTVTVAGGTNETVSSQLTSSEPSGALGLRGTYQVSVSQTIASETMTAATPLNMQTIVQAHWSLVSAAYPNCPINLVVWDQGENDNSGTYATLAAYGAAFNGATYNGAPFVGSTGVVPLFQALSGWSAQTRWINVELGTWASNTQQFRNDFLRRTRDGLLYPWMDFVSTTGLSPSVDAPVPHYSGAALEAIGQRDFQTWAKARLLGAYHESVNYNGGAQATPNALTANNNGAITATIGASFTASASAGTLTVSAVTGGVLSVGDTLATGTLAGSAVTALGTGTGGTGTYTISSSTTASSQAMTTSSYTLNVTAVATGTLSTALWIAGTGVTNPSIVNALSAGTGGTGTYLLSASSPYTGSVAMTAYPSFSADDVRSGALIDATTPFILPSGATVPVGTTITIYVEPTTSTLAVYSQGPMNGANVGTVLSFANYTLRGGYNYTAVVTPDQRWTISGLNPVMGNLRCFENSSALQNASVTYASVNLNHSCTTLTNMSMTLSPVLGNEWTFNDVTTASTVTLSSGNFVLPSGATASTLTLQPGEFAVFKTMIGASNTVFTYVEFDNLTSRAVAPGPTFTASGCAVSSLTGGNTAGKFTSGTTGTCAPTLTMGGGLSAPNGWHCNAVDETTHTLLAQSAASTTGCTITGSTTSGDAVSFDATGY